MHALKNVYQITIERWRKWETDEIWNRRLLAHGDSELYEIEYIRKDGTVFPVELRSYAVRCKDGTIDYLWGAARVISRRREAENRLRRKTEMLSRTERIADVGSWEWDIAADVVTWSEELFRIFGRDPAGPAPSFAEHPDLYLPEDMQRLKQAVEACVSDGTPYELARKIRDVLSGGPASA